MNLDNDKRITESTEKGDRATEFDHAIRYIRCLLRLLGIWSLVASKQSGNEYVLSKRVLIPFVSILMTSLTFPICYYIASRPIERLETIILLGPVTFQIGNILMHFGMIARSSSIKICIDHMKLDWQRVDNSEEHRIMIRYTHLSHGLTVACVFFMYSSAVLYGLVKPLLSGNTINEMNETIRPRMFPGTEIFFDVQASVVYEIVYTLNFISMLLHFTISTIVCLLPIVLISHASGQIEIIMLNLNSVIDRVYEYGDRADSSTKQMGFTIRRHVRLLKFTMNIETCMKEMMLIEIVTLTLIICFLEYDVLVTMETNDGNWIDVLTYILHLIGFSFNLFLYCQFGEILKRQCENIGNVAYSIDWLRLPGRTKLALVMVINISNHACSLTAGGMMELSRANFASILKTSFAYFNMMRTMG